MEECEHNWRQIITASGKACWINIKSEGWSSIWRIGRPLKPVFFCTKCLKQKLGTDNQEMEY